MDEEDEARFLAMDRYRQRNGDVPRPSDFYEFYAELRLYQGEEYDYLQTLEDGIPRPREMSPAALQRAELVAQGVPYHHIRFCDTMIGFHEGDLDLAGRHAPRYESLHRRWIEFITDLAATANIPLGLHGEEQPVGSATAPSLKDPDMNKVKAFQTKWRMQFRDIYTCRSMLESVLGHIVSGHPPVLQRRCLLDLPNEMLHYVGLFAGPKDLRNLGLVCKMLRAACWRTLNRERVVGFDVTRRSFRNASRLLYLPDAERAQLLYDMSRAEMDWFREDARLISARPDIAQSIRRLTFQVMEWPGMEGLDMDEGDHALVARMMRDVALKTINVTRLTLQNVMLGSECADAIFSIPHLTYLAMHSSGILTGQLRVRPTRLQHLVLRWNITGDPDVQWRLMPYLPAVRWLYVYTTPENFNLPSDSLLKFFNPVVGLERLQICRLDRTDADDEFATVLGLLKSAEELALTHVKLGIPSGIFGRETRELAAALARAPLQMLSLEYIRHATPRLLKRIATLLPRIVGLTLQMHPLFEDTRDARWPGTPEAYAAALAGCASLEYFAWNYRLHDVRASPAAILHFEEGFCKGACAHADALDAVFDEAADIARVFAARCPALRVLAFVGRTYRPDPLCLISRDALGNVCVEEHRPGRKNVWEMAESLSRYDPEPLFAWPMLDGKPSEVLGRWAS